MHPGERIKNFRKKKGVNQKYFAGALGYSNVYLSEIERGDSLPSREFLIKLNEIFGISSDYILYGSPPDQAEVRLPDHPETYAKKKKEMMIIHEPKSKYQALPTSIKKLLDNVKEILESKNEAMIDLFKTNTKGILEVIRTNKKRELK